MSNDAANDTVTITLDLWTAGGKSYGSKFKLGEIDREEGVVRISCTSIDPDALYQGAMIRIGRSSLTAMLTRAVMGLHDVDTERS